MASKLARPRLNCFLLRLTVAGIFWLYACGGHSSNESSSSNTGSLSFGLVYQVDGGAGNRYSAAAELNCSGQGIAFIQAYVYNENNSLIGSSGDPWDCESGQGTIGGVPAGSNRRVVVIGTDTAHNVVVRGESPNVEVVAGQANSAGIISCHDFVPTLQSPVNGTEVAAGFSLSWSAVTGAYEYGILISENSNMTNPFIDGTTTATAYLPSGFSNGQTYYWQVVAIDAYTNAGAGSSIWQFTFDESHANISPDANITSPSEGSTFTAGDDIQFTGSGTDAEDGPLTGISLVWRSDLDGQIGTGVDFTRNDLSSGTHTITLTVTDSNGATAADARSIAVLPSEWVKLLGSAGYDYGYGIAVDTTGNAYITGNTDGDLDGNTNAGRNDIFVSKYDGIGTRIWTKLLGTAGYDHGRGIAVDPNGNAYLTGSTNGDLEGNAFVGSYDIFVSKYDTDGTRLWTRQLGTTESDHSYGIAVDPSGNVYITGFTEGDLDGNANAGYRDIFVSKYDTDGTRLWTRQLGTTEAEYGYGIVVDPSGNAYITGKTHGDLDGNANTGNEDIFVSKYDTNGVLQWTSLLGTAGNESGSGIAADSNGNVYITGYTNGDLDGNTNAGGEDIFISKFNTNGILQWTSLLGTVVNESGSGITVDPNGNVYITGYTNGDLDGNTNAGGRDIFVSKYDTNGNGLWTSLLGTTINDRGHDIAVDPNSNAYITGRTQANLGGNNSAGNGDIFIWKLPN
jgi:hypothetical protein